MTERFIAPVLTFAVLIAGHVAIVSALFAGPAPQSAEATVVAKAPALVVKQAS